MTYPRALDYLNSFVNYERLNSYPYNSAFKLERVQGLLRLLGSPQRNLRTIHIAGTKGKGSTCAFVANILKEERFKVGLYTSPHLMDVRERIRILQRTENPPAVLKAGRAGRKQKTEKERIPRKDFARLIEKIKPYAEKLRQTKLGRLTYYEILTVLAFLYFKEEECNFVVLETGLGGRLDATNVAESFICAITPISYEHTQVLGTTLKAIAAEKAGIIKFTVKRQIVVTAPQAQGALGIIRRRVKKCGATLFEIGKDIRFKERSASSRGQSFDIKGIFAEYPGLKIGLLGKHQVVNAVVAVACVESLRFQGVKISLKALREGLKKTSWPGRLQIISQRPRIILDAAHNRASASALKDTLTNFFKFRNLILVFGVFRDKDVKGILKELMPSANRIILTKAPNPRAMEPKIIKGFIKGDAKPVALTQNVAQALKIAAEEAGEKDLILVCGSLYLLGEVLKRKNEKDIFR